MEMSRRWTGGEVSRRYNMHCACWLLLASIAAAALTGCTGADRNDPTYNTKQILINDPRQ
jgi:hypothetical protein